MLGRLATDQAVLLHELKNAGHGRAPHLEHILDVALKQLAVFPVAHHVAQQASLHAGDIVGRFRHARHLAPHEIVQQADFRTDVVHPAAAGRMIMSAHLLASLSLVC